MNTEKVGSAPPRTKRDPRFVSQLTRHTYAVVLAGGRGSRLKQLTDWRSKPAVPFGGKFRIIDFTLSNCVNSGIRRIGVATQYKAQSLIRHLQRGWSFLDGRFDEFIEIMPAQQNIDESQWYQGTADAVFQNLDVLRRSHAEYVLVLSGDHIYKMDYGRMLAAHVAAEADLTIGCIEVPIKEASAFGVMAIKEDGRVMAFSEKPKDPAPVPGNPDVALASMGIYVFNARFLYEQLVRDSGDRKSSHDFGKDIIPHCVKRYRVYSHRFNDSCVGPTDREPYWRDVGTIDAFWEANMELTKVTPELNMYDEEWPIWTWQEQLPPAKFVFDWDDRRGMAVDSMVAGGCIISGATVRRSMLFSRVQIHSHAIVEDSVVLPDVDIGRDAVIRRAVLDKRCSIPEGMQIGVDLEEDRKRFHVSENGVVLVTPEMLGQQVHFIR
ncbi:glucose-1-phosphate adenylyltransferase [Niveibacterium sp. SC-1]|uniref:glucose-1-phosphate adenylyltransferase n=1 Tax=Niveibacterium sp. SC-1 TaxID=3135646 RepID=UPI00311DBFC0